MPRRNGAGPMGNGPMTGRSMGLCNDNGLNCTRGFGRGRCYGNNNISPTKENLEQEKIILKQRLEEIEKELV